MLVENLAGWALDTYRRRAVPEPVFQLAAHQRKSVFAALAAGVAVNGGPTFDATQSPEDELYAAVDAAAALDFDDYLCFGHAGLSSVLASAIISARCGSAAPEHADVAAAQVVAAELHARLAGACLLGPHGPTQWAYAHAVSAAAAAGLLVGLDERELSHALAIAMAQPAIPTRAAFFGPDTRSLTVANAAVLGLRAAQLAAAGRTGPLNVLDDVGGFCSVLVRRPVPEMLTGLGSGWALRTLSVKTSPSCSYVDPALDALRSLLPLDAEDVERVDVSAAMPTVMMTRLARRYLPCSGLTPSTAAFSVPLSIALLLRHGELTPRQLAPGELRRTEGAVRSFADRVRVRHSFGLTRRLVRSLAGVYPLHRMLLARRLPWTSGLLTPAGARPWSPSALGTYRMSFPVRLSVLLRDGRRLRAAAEVPDGAAGSRVLSPADAAAAKFGTWAKEAWGAAFASEFQRTVESETHLAWRLLTTRR